MTATTSPPLGTIGQIAINVRDIARAVRFYRDTLGLPFVFEAPPALAFFKCGDVTLMLSPPESAEFDHPSSVLYSTPRTSLRITRPCARSA